MKRLGVVIGLCVARLAHAESECRGVEIELVPSDKLQIVAWIEDAAGNYVDTAFITQSTGLHGLGNRVGDIDVHSGPMWPFGARESVLPIWAHRHGLTWPRVIWQSGDGLLSGSPQDPDHSIDVAFADTSVEPFYCRPIMPTEMMWDAGTCATTVYTDKGRFSSDLTSHYPPRADLPPPTPLDHVDIAGYAASNPFDAVSHATPAADIPYRAAWSARSSVADGDYVLRVEVSKESDFNASYPVTRYPTSQIPWRTYGLPYRGQPSVIYEVPFSLGSTDSITSTLDYAGYSDMAGAVHAPDSTITSDTPGSGASRLRIAIDTGAMYRVRVTARPERDSIGPSDPTEPIVEELEPTRATLTFRAPGDDGDTGTVARYDVRYRIGYSLDEATFESATPIHVEPRAAGLLQTIELDLAPQTPYVVGIRAFDNCGHASALVVMQLETPSVEVSGCGCSGGDPTALALLGLLGLRRRRA